MMTRLLLALAGVAFILGCSAQDALETSAGADFCAEIECGEGFTCQFGICVEDEVEATELSIALLISPPSFREDLGELHITQLPVTLGMPLPDYALQPPAVVDGVVLFNATDSDVASPVEGEVRFRSVRGIPGFEFETSTRIDAGGLYAIDVPRGLYDVSILPARADLSRTTARGVAIAEQTEFKPFTVIAPGQYDVIAGVVERGEGSLDPVVGARVFAVSADGEHETTVDVTGETGQFILFAPPGEQPYTFHVRPTDESTWVPYATFEPVDVVSGEEVRLRVGAFPEPVPVQLNARTTDGAEVFDVAVSIRSEIEAGEGAPALVSAHYLTLVGSDQVNDSGQILVDLPPVMTEFHAAPLGPELGPALPVRVAIAEDGGEVTVTLEQRHLIEGHVLGENSGSAVGDVSVHATWVGSDLMPLSRYPLPESLFEAATTSGADGAFSFQVPPGDWRVEFAPPLDAGFGYSRRDLSVGRETIERFDAVLPESGAVRGRLFDDDGAPLVGASVRAFSLEGDETLLIGEASTDATGAYRLVLSSDVGRETPSQF